MPPMFQRPVAHGHETHAGDDPNVKVRWVRVGSRLECDRTVKLIPDTVRRVSRGTRLIKKTYLILFWKPAWALRDEKSLRHNRAR